MRKIFFLLTALTVMTAGLLAQQTEDKTQLEKERQEIQKEIKEIQDLQNKVKGQKKQIVGQYNLIDRKIKLQNRYIANINKQLRFIDDDIYLSNVEIFRLGRQLDTLKAQYARSVVYAYKNRSTYDFLNFIFSANSFNDAIKRVAYLKSYRAFREQQVNTIKETQVKLAKRKVEQLGKKKCLAATSHHPRPCACSPRPKAGSKAKRCANSTPPPNSTACAAPSASRICIRAKARRSVRHS